MFSGDLIVHNHKYFVYGTDNSSVCSLIIDSDNEENQRYMLDARQDDILIDIFTRKSVRVDVGLCKVTVEATTTQGDSGKKIKSKYNPELFCRLGALLQYVKHRCNNETRVDFVGVGSLGGEAEFSSTFDYEVPFPLEKEKTLAKVRLTYGNVVDIDIQCDNFSFKVSTLRSEDDPRMLYKIKDGWSSAFKQNEEYLGFPIPLPNTKIAETFMNDGLYHSLDEVIAAHPDKEFEWLRGKNYIIVSDETLDDTIAYLNSYTENGKLPYLYYDTETTGLNITFMSRLGRGDQLVGVVLSVRDGESFFFPTRMKKIPNLCGGDDIYFMEHYMRPLLEGRELATHNGPFDWKVAHIYGINANIVHDTIALLTVTLGRQNMLWTMISLKKGAKIALNRDSLELSDLVVNDTWGKNSMIDFSDLPYELVKYYACADTDNTRGLLKYCLTNDFLGQYNASKIYEIEVAFGLAVAYQEFYGHKLDINSLDHLKKDTDANLDTLKKKIFEIAGHEFNINSSPQLLKVLYEEQGIPKQISRKTGKVSADATILKTLSEYTNDDDEPLYPIVALLRDYRKYEGVRKIVDKFPETMTEDGYIFSSVNQYGTATGRLSVQDPNYQSYSDAIKKNVCPRPGFYMFDTDYSSVEYRVLASMVGNKNIIEAFKDPDFDYHTYQASHMFQIPYEQVTKKLRKQAKSINFGLPYGMGDASLGAQIFGEMTSENTIKAKKLREAYFKGQEDIRDWFEYHRNRGVNEGFTETFFGRRRYYDKHTEKESAIRRQAGNQVIQGTAADVYKLAVGRVFKRICKEGWLGKVLLVGFIHDEVLGEVSCDIDPAYFLKVLREEFEVKIKNPDGTPWCPLYMGFGYGTSWYEAKSVELPIKLQWEIVERYSETGFPIWEGDPRAFCDKIPDLLRDFEVRDIGKQLLAEESQGKIIKASLNSAVIDCSKTDADEYSKGIEEYAKLDDWQKSEFPTLESYMDTVHHIQCVLRDENNEIIPTISGCKHTQESIDQFCKLHGLDRSKIDILDIPDAVETNNSVSIDVSDYTPEAELEPDYIKRLVRLTGYHVQVFGEKIIRLYVTDDTPVTFIGILKEHIKSAKDIEGEVPGYMLQFLRVRHNNETGLDEESEQITSFYVPFSELDFIKDLWVRCASVVHNKIVL